MHSFELGDVAGKEELDFFIFGAAVALANKAEFIKHGSGNSKCKSRIILSHKHLAKDFDKNSNNIIQYFLKMSL